MPVPHQMLGRFTGRTSGVNDTKLADKSSKNRIKSLGNDSMLEVIQSTGRGEIGAMGRPQKCTQNGVAIYCDIGDRRRG
jgi:hypothetical protein